MICGERLVLDEWHTRQLEALRALAEKLDRPVLRHEIAAELGVDKSEMTLTGLFRRGWILFRKVEGEEEKGVIARPIQKPQIGSAIDAFEQLEDGITYEWAEPRKDSRLRPARRSLTLTRADRSHLRGTIRAVVEYLGLRSVRQIEHHHLSMIPGAVWTLSMERSLVPRNQWNAGTEAAKRARRTASKRRSEMTRFLSWCEWQGYLSLAGFESDTLPPEWIRFVQAAGGDRRAMSSARMLAGHAMRAGADCPERVPEIGFDRVEDEVRGRKSLSSERAVATTLSRMRVTWDLIANRWETLPPWPRPERRVGARRGDGGLEQSWWSAPAFFDRRPSLLNQPGMEEQLRQATDLRDWWTLEDPTRRPTDRGGPLPARPKQSRSGMRRLGARDAGESTAVRYLAAISRLQRFVLTFDASAHRRPWREDADPVGEYDARLAEQEVRRMGWAELLSDRDRVLRCVEFEFERDLAEKGGVLYAGIRRILALYTILWAYMPAWDRAELQRITDERIDLELSTEAGMKRSRLLDRRDAALKASIARWERLADEVLERYSQLEAAAGGVQKRADRTAIRRVFSHADARRCADHFREQRLERDAALREQTEKLVREAQRRRRTGCDQCGRTACDAHHPAPRVGPRGIALEVLDRTYCTLANKELVLRFPSILPWRPSTFRRAQVGIHILEDLSIAVVGRDGKVERDSQGRVKRQEARVPDLEHFEDADEIAHLIEVLRIVMHETRVWLWENPTKTGVRLRNEQGRSQWSRALFLNSYGVPWGVASSFADTMRSALEEAAQAINARLEDGERPIELPTGYAARGSYIMRFLWGHRAAAHGVPYRDIAAVLGNTEATVRKHYQDVQPNDALNRVARAVREARTRAPESGYDTGPAMASAPGEVEVRSPLERLAGYRADKIRIQAEGAELGLSPDEVAQLLKEARTFWGLAV